MSGVIYFIEEFQFDADESFAMDPLKLTIKVGKWIVLPIGVIALVGAGVGVWRTVVPKDPQARLRMAHRLMENIGVVSILQIYADAFHEIQNKVDQMHHSQEENKRLVLENARLKQKLGSHQFECRKQEAVATTKDYEIRLNKETGTRVGRTLASMSYRPPEKLYPNQLYTLGLNYVREKDDEKVAVIFSNLTGLEDTDKYKTPRNHLIAGVAWYRLENLRLADFYLDKALEPSNDVTALQFQAQARLWKALIAKKTRDEKQSQHWLRELVDHHPHSTEAEWVNVITDQKSKAKKAKHGKSE